VRVSVKLSVVFCVTGLFLLAVEVAAVMAVNHLNEILGDTTYFNQQMEQVSAALHAARLSPARTADHLARVDDLQKWARTDEEQKLLLAAREDLTTTRSMANTTTHLEELNNYYLRATATAHRSLLQFHHRIVIGIIVIMIDSILLFILLTWMIRSWLLHPVRDLGETIGIMAEGKTDRTVYSNAGQEFEQIGKSLNALTARLRDFEKRVADSEKFAQLGTACTHITHSVRSLLHSIRSLAQYESNATTADPDSRVGFNYIIATVNKLDAWVRDVHRAVRPMDVALAPHQVEPIIHDALSLLQPSLSERSLTVDYRTADEIPDVVIDRGLFEQAFVAVISNAIEASPDNGRISIALQNGADHVTVRIEDGGEGMTEATRSHALDPFFSTKPERTGLGLSVAHSIVKQHGGEIEIESAPNKGTRVLIHLPVAKPAPTASKSAPSASTHR
jgi:signal transduction histidine kinase